MLFFDLETLPTNDAAIIADIAASIKPPGQFKNAKSIEQWLDENKANELKKLVSKTSFSGMYGRIACIAWAHDDNEVGATININDEREVIRHFYDCLKLIDDKQSIFCGHNLYGFDLPFLKQRSIILGIEPPKTLLKAMNSKAWDGCIADTMFMWAPERDKHTSMDKLCKAFGIGGKGDFDGSMVADTWETDPQKVIDYCKDDVERTRKIYKRLTFS